MIPFLCLRQKKLSSCGNCPWEEREENSAILFLFSAELFCLPLFLSFSEYCTSQVHVKMPLAHKQERKFVLPHVLFCIILAACNSIISLGSFSADDLIFWPLYNILLILPSRQEGFSVVRLQKDTKNLLFFPGKSCATIHTPKH